LTGLSINVQSPDLTLQYGVDESYTLTISGVTAQLSAKTVWGALHGLETFSQCVSYTDATGYFVDGFPVIIDDAPRFAWRGLMVDTSRHYLAPSTLLYVPCVYCWCVAVHC
jgi:hexosaminidase